MPRKPPTGTTWTGPGVSIPEPQRRYRIRWALVSYRQTRERRCLAERRVFSIAGMTFWWPIDGDWRRTEAEARRDIEHDDALRRPLPPTKLIAVVPDMQGEDIRFHPDHGRTAPPLSTQSR